MFYLVNWPIMQLPLQNNRRLHKSDWSVWPYENVCLAKRVVTPLLFHTIHSLYCVDQPTLFTVVLVNVI